MAGEWIKVRTNLWDDPRIGQLCEITDQGEAAVIGGLYWLWATADEHSSDGLLSGMTTRTIDRKTGVPGLGAALVTIGWLTEEGNAIRVVRFEEHNGTSAKTRADTARRVANHRNKKDPTDTVSTGAQTKCLPRPIRSHIMERDNATCVYCGRLEGQIAPHEVATDGYMHIDHVIPATRGGSDEPSNLVCACAVCNRFKSNRTPDECGLPWPKDETGMKRGCNAKPVTTALPREDKNKEQLPPIPPEGGEPSEQKRKAAVSLRSFLADCRSTDTTPIPDGHPVFAYADKVALPRDFLALQWVEFKDRYQLPDAKRYKDWRTVFLKSVKGNWFKLWFVGADGQYALTTVGQQAQRSHKEAA